MRRLLLIAMCYLLLLEVAAQTAGGLMGKITDKSSREPLIGATIGLLGTTIGDITDVNGNFSLFGISSGKKIFEVRFIGYKSQQLEVTISAGELTIANISMELDAQIMDEIVVTAQALGQAGAINQQINSSTIMNVVSKDKIRELPDQNAAETVGRISGIYIQRDAGEGQKVVVRGLAPRFNNVTINGQRIPSTDANDRSVDLSMISPSMLSGIEVYKSARPDQDGDAIGGTVNFLFRKATEDPELLINAQTGYNGIMKEFGQYKMDLSYGRRFAKNKLGLYATGNLQRVNRSSDQLRGSYLFLGEDVFGQSLISPSELDLAAIVETRKRYGASLTADYTLNPRHSIIWDNVYSYTDRDEVRRRRRYRWGEQRQEYEIRDRTISIGLFTTSLSGNHKLGEKLELTWTGSYSKSVQDNPNNYTSRYRETSAFNSTGVDLTGQPLDSIPKLARNNLEETFLNQVFLDSDQTNDQIITAQVDLKIPYSSSFGSGFFKTGLKVRDNQRARERNSNVGNYFSPLSQELAFFINDFPNLFQRVPSNGGIAISNFLSGFTADNFLNGQYFLGPGAGEINGPGLNRNLTGGLIRNMASLNYLSKDYLADIDDYTSTETIYSGYVMAEHNFSQKLLILAGVRVEQTKTTYRGNYMISGIDYDDGGAFEQLTIDSLGGRTYTELLPMVNIRYKVNSWSDIRAAATRTLSRPDFTNLIPFRRINDNEQTIRQADPNLLHTTSWNYDLTLSFYNKYGLISLSGFYKQLRNIDYERVFTRILPPDDQYVGYEISTPDNSGQPTTIMGMEFDLQANLRFLPKPLNGIILSANATILDSETFYPFIPAPLRSSEPPFTPTVLLDEFRPGRAPRQANFISNISIGYEVGGFSGRVSMVYQGDTSSEIGPVPALDSYTGRNTRFDLALRQKVSKKLRVYFNWNNFTNAAELSFLGDTSRPTSEVYFGFTADLGLQFRL